MSTAIHDLIQIMQTLRSDVGCNWDRKQTLQSLKKYLLEEAYEVIDTIDALTEHPTEKNTDHHREELGDLLLQVVFQSQIQAELGHFTFDDVVVGITEKMRRRHPHIFGDQKLDRNVEGNPYWHAIKSEESNQKGLSTFDSVSKSQPALLRAAKLGEKAANLGFDWANANDAIDKIQEELNELKDALAQNNHAHAQEEMGDLLHAIAQAARHLGVDPELALHHGNEKFLARFHAMAQRAGGEHALKQLSLEQMTQLWDQIKA